MSYLSAKNDFNPRILKYWLSKKSKYQNTGLTINDYARLLDHRNFGNGRLLNFICDNIRIHFAKENAEKSNTI